MEQTTPAAAMSALLQAHRSIRRYDATRDIDAPLLQQVLVDAFAVELLACRSSIALPASA